MLPLCQDKACSKFQIKLNCFFRSPSFVPLLFNDLRIGFIIILTLFYGVSAFSQTATNFQRVYGGTGQDQARSIINTQDGGYAATGFTTSFGAGGEDVYVIKTDANGTETWSRTFGGIGNDRGYSIVQTGDGGYMVGGDTYTFGAGNQDLFLIRLDSNGNTLWTKVIGLSLFEYTRILRETPDGGFVSLGYSNSTGLGQSDLLLVKISAAGNIEWAKAYGLSVNEFPHYLDITADSGFAITGYRNFGGSFWELYMLKADKWGNFEWAKTYSGPNLEIGLGGLQTNLACCTNGGFALTGFTTSFGAGGRDVLVIKTDNQGNVTWAKTYGGAGKDEGSTILHKQNGDFVIGGITASFGSGSDDFYLLTTDNLGNIKSSSTFGGPNIDLTGGLDNNIRLTPEGGIIMAGSTNSFGFGGDDMYLIKIDPSGNSGCNQVDNSVPIVTSPSLTVNAITPNVISPTLQSMTPTLLTTTPVTLGDTLCMTLPLVLDTVGVTCSDAIPEIMSSTSCTSTQYTSGVTDKWFSFVATGLHAQIILVGDSFGNTVSPHIHNISLFEGICSNLTLIAEDELPFIDIAEELTVDVSGLVVGNTYYLKVGREASAKACPSCSGSGFPSASFSLCIQEVEVFQPFDFSFILSNFGVIDAPSSSHTYYTNKGQIVDKDGNARRDIKLYTIGATPEAYVTDNTVSYVFSRFDTVNGDSLHRVDMTFVGANPDAKVFKTEQVDGDLNYYLGHIPNGITDMKGYSKAVCNNVYSNIDMQLSSNSEGMKYLFIRRPGGDPDDIVMKFDGASSVDVTPDGGLRVATPLGKIEFDPGHAYAINNAGNVVPMPWQAKFVKVTTNSVKFDIHSFPSFMPMVIQVDKGHKVGATGQVDNLEWSTYYGGGFADGFANLATNLSGDVFVTGVTVSTNFPVSVGASQDTLSSSGLWDVTLAKFNDNGVRQWATYYGGTDHDGSGAPHGIAVDITGTSYIAFGTFSNDIPIANPGGNAYIDSTLNFPNSDLLIAKFSNNGQLIWSTHYGNSGSGKAFDVALNNTGELYVVGTTLNADLFPATGAFNSTVGQGLILKFTTLGERLWVTRFGGSIGSMTIHKATVDGANNLILTGFTSATSGFPIANPGGGAYVDSTFNGGSFDAFISKFDNNDDLIWSTYWGGDDDDRSFAIATDGWNNIWLSGNTLSTDFPISRPNSFAYVDSSYNGRGSLIGTAGDAFIGKFTSSGEIQVSTYYGSTANESAANLALDDLNNLYVVGLTSSDSFPFASPNLSGGFIQSVLSDGEDGPFDGFIAAFNPSFERIWTTYFGGTLSSDGIDGVTVFGNSKLYIAGTGGSSTDFPWRDLQGGAWYDENLSFPSTDAFIARFDLAGIPLGTDRQSLLVSEGELTIYPNPSNGIFTVQFNMLEADKLVLTVYDIQGKKLIVKEQKISSAHILKLDLSRYSPGVYHVLMSTTKEVFNTKIVLTR